LRCAGLQARVLVMGGFLPQESDALVHYDLTPAVHGFEDLARIDSLARSAERPLRFHLKIDSGMGRLGTRASAGELIEALLALRHARLEGLMTHFASAANYVSSQTDHQIARFEQLRADFGRAGIVPNLVHMCSTNAIGFGRREAWHHMVRAGHALYGYVSPPHGPAPPQLLSVGPALTWKAKLLSVKEVPEGTLIGYGGSFRASRPMRIGVLAVGYADGVFHRLSNRGKVIADGKLTAILGAVSMDLTTIDLSHTMALQPGDEVTLLGTEGDAQLDAQQIARLAGTISYNILCGIGPRVRRVYS
jgi:alanine racemase